ncbi:MAG: hypothetical protein ACXVBE_07190, partial [Bdellovibrionota bacterium]
SDPYYASLDMIRNDMQLNSEQQKKLISLYQNAEQKAADYQGEIDKKRGQYLRAVMKSNPERREVFRLRDEMRVLNLKRNDVRLDMIDQIWDIVKYSTGVDFDIFERAFLREERRRAELEKLQCGF